MGQSQRSFDQVKSILGKLDRNIDAARSRRLHDHTAPAAPIAPPPPVIPQSSVLTPAPKPVPQGPVPNGRSPFGRAQPMRLARPNNGSSMSGPLTGT